MFTLSFKLQTIKRIRDINLNTHNTRVMCLIISLIHDEAEEIFLFNYINKFQLFSCYNAWQSFPMYIPFVWIFDLCFVYF